MVNPLVASAASGIRFRFGGLLFEGFKLATPDGRPSMISGVDGFAEAFHERGGATCAQSGERTAVLR